MNNELGSFLLHRDEELARDLPDYIESCMCPRMFVQVQGTSASSKITNSLLFRPKCDFCHCGQYQTLDPSPCPMKILNGSYRLFASMYTWMLQLDLLAQVLHAQMID